MFSSRNAGALNEYYKEHVVYASNSRNAGELNEYYKEHVVYASNSRNAGALNEYYKFFTQTTRCSIRIYYPTGRYINCGDREIASCNISQPLGVLSRSGNSPKPIIKLDNYPLSAICNYSYDIICVICR